jgi:hypothetical protein
MGLGARFSGFGKAEKGCGKAQSGWQGHCYFIAPHISNTVREV